MRSLACMLGVIVVTVAAVPATAAADWPVYGHDLSNSRSAGNAGPPASAVPALERAWTFSAPSGDFTGTPVVAGGAVVAGTNLGSVFALGAVTGKVLWSRDAGGPVNGSASIDLRAPGGPTVFVPVARIGGPRLLALSLATGAVRWAATLSRQDGSDVFGSPVFWNRTVYIGTSGPNNDETTARGSVVALDEATGALRWRTYTVPAGRDGGAVWSTPAIDRQTGRLYVGTGNAYHSPAAATTDAMLALSASSGRILRHFQATAGDVFQVDSPAGPDHDFGASPNLIRGAGGRALVGEGSKSGTYWALDRRTMRPVWRRSVGPGSAVGGILGSTAYDGARIFGDDTIDGQIWALGRDGLSRWNSADGPPPDFAPVTVANGVLYSGGPSGLLTARDAATGAVLAKLPLGGAAFGGVAASGRALYAAVGTGPPPQVTPAEPDTSSADGSGSIVAFGDTSSAGASPIMTFQGSCKFSGPVVFDPPLTTTPRPTEQHITAPGTCSGTLVDRAGRAHRLDGAPATYAESARATASCASGTPTGRGSLTFAFGTLRFAFAERRAGALATATATGEGGGSAAGTGSPSSGANPFTPLRCAGAGIDQVPIDVQLATTPSISG